MARVAPLTDTKLPDLWKEVKEPDSEEFWGDLREASIKMVKELLERSLEEEMVCRLQAPRYSRSTGRRGWRNGLVASMATMAVTYRKQWSRPLLPGCGLGAGFDRPPASASGQAKDSRL